MNLKHLSYFVEIAKKESFTKAAEDLYISQSALSKAVKSLEEELGVVLIERTNKKFNLTDEGKILFSEGEKVLQYISESEKELEQKIHKKKRCLKVGIPPVISTAYFGSLIYGFRAQYEYIELEVIEAGANTVQNLVDDGSIDIGVVILPIMHEEKYHIIPAMSSENVAIVNKDHPFAERTEVPFAALKNEKFLILNETYMLHDKILSNCAIAGFFPHITTRSSQWDFLAELVALNQGISILPKPIVERFYSKERIKMLRLVEPKFPWHIAMINDKEKLITEQMEIFANFVTEKSKDFK